MANDKVADTKSEVDAEKAYASAAADTGAKKSAAPVAAKASVPAPAAKAAAPEAPKTAPAAAAVKADNPKADTPKPIPPIAVAKTEAPKVTAKKVAARKAKAAAKPAPAKRTPAQRTSAKPAPLKAPIKQKSVVSAVRKPTTPEMPTISELKDKIMATAPKTDFTAKLNQTDFTATVKDMAAEAQTKAKEAYEKFTGYAGEMTEFAKGNVEAMVEAGKILGTGMQSIARDEVEAAKSAMETATADMKAMAAIKSPADLFKLQGEIARRNFDAMVAHSSKNAEAGMKLAGDAFAPLSNRMSLAAEKFAKVA